MVYKDYTVYYKEIIIMENIQIMEQMQLSVGQILKRNAEPLERIWPNRIMLKQFDDKNLGFWVKNADVDEPFIWPIAIEDIIKYYAAE